MWNLNRITKTISDMTVGTVIVLVHVVLADRETERTKRERSRGHSRPPTLPS